MSGGLRLTEIFFSLQGESRTIGIPTVFVRLAGCPLRCTYCDTPYAFKGGDFLSQGEILCRVARYGCRYVTVTGGEPLAQKGCLKLLLALADEGYEVSLETSGALDIAGVDPRISRVMDLKTPGSGEIENNRYENLQYLNQHDQLKFVICGRTDYDWAKEQMLAWRLTERCEILFSPAAGHQDARELAEWILADRLPVRFQMQLHRLLWGDEKGR
ncbi:MAG: 7-carboxy-7-deazaguanine synthase QueE [Gammaproteobacteria bacterium]|nr:7-carboxy-7-deazaguanine synthase QueE [Gammaproteobacteria bacterium]MBU1654258.1 7-carboxy-7-deazaguanine synthase QueE [Gammaproteobacteria bacterium]MBU1960406.1 7-carboxy-7-deazaguanine synthase QueE [Gammaproteobacteria bacterium]